MTAIDYRQMLDSIQSDLGGFGPARIAAIEDEFPEPEPFIDACRDAYERRDTDVLERIHGVGHSYAVHGLAMWAAEYFGWEGGDAEPQVIPVQTGADVLEAHDGPVVILSNPDEVDQ